MLSRTKSISLGILLGAALIGFFVYESEVTEEGFMAAFPFQFGLDIQGGAHLVYDADVSGIEDPAEINRRMDALRGLIEERVNALGVSEPLVQTERGGLLGEGQHRLIVDIDEAIAAIGETPVLEFMLLREGADPNQVDVGDLDLNIGDQEDEVEVVTDEEDVPTTDENDQNDPEEDTATEEEDDLEEEEEESIYIYTGLDGSMLNDAQFQRDPNTGEPVVSLRFNSEGRNLFADITREHTGRQLAVLLDGEPISVPVIREPILGGEAIISGTMSVTEARDLARRLQAGALPVPIDLVSTETVGATLGQEILEDGVVAATVGLTLVALFMVLWYRLPGVVSVASLSVYIILMLAIFKLIPVTLTAAGIAGFILSIGMAVDANIIIFERMKEELRRGRFLTEAIEVGFSRAWLSIRDANVSSMITAIILYWFGTPLVQGFALVFFIGVLISMITAISVTRTFLLAIGESKEGTWFRTLFYSGKEKPNVVQSEQY